MTGISDSFHRPINYLRVSITDRCNLRCIYCLPANGVNLLSHNQILNYEEIVTIAKIAAELGITKLRLTGGEPLVRANLPRLISMLSKIDTIDDISMTTNGTLLKHHAHELKQAGLRRVNISLDSLKQDKFELITRQGKLSDVFQGIDAAIAAGLEPIKINMVVMHGINEDEITDFARLTITEGWHVRFIELMPFATDNTPDEHSRQWESSLYPKFMPVSEVEERIRSIGNLEPSPAITGNGPAKYFRLPHAKGTIGFIAPISQCFCYNCNRLRLTSEGKLRACLLNDEEVDLRQPLRNGSSHGELAQLIKEAIRAKPLQHQLAQGLISKKRLMSQVGG